jgi:hypothetical protein
VLFGDLYISASRCALLLEQLFAHACRNSHPGLHTKRLHVYEGGHEDDEQPPALMALVPYMPNLLSFSAREHTITSRELLSLCQHGRSALQTLDICFSMVDAPSVLAIAGRHCVELRAFRIEPPAVRYRHQLQYSGSFDLCAPLMLQRLARFEAVISFCLLPEFTPWLARCKFPVLAHLVLEIGLSLEGHDLGVLQGFARFFATHRALRTLSINACEAVTLALLQHQLPPGLRHVALRGKDALPRTLPVLPPGVRRLALCADPEVSDLWDLLAHLLRVHTFSLTEIAITFVETTVELSEFVRSFSWSRLLLPPRGVHMLADSDARICGNMMLYALEFRQRGISVIDEYDHVWPPCGESGQWDITRP